MSRIQTFATTLVVSLGVCAAGAATPHAQAAPDKPRPAYTITLGIDNVSPEVGDTVKVTGAVEPAVPGETVRLQTKFQGHKRWKTINTYRLYRNGKYKFHTGIRTLRTRQYRAVMVRAGFRWTSNHQKVRVYAWVPLSSVEPGGGEGFLVGDAVIDGVTYPNSLVATGAPSKTVVWHTYLDFRCLSLRGVVGLSDGSPTGSGGAIAIGGPETALTPGNAVPITLDVRQAFDLPISARSTGGGIPVVGSPEVLCYP